ncbi:esterase-like activity of phytase family protein [Altericista sp. CCNU0014]|uniref:esterase-like activity of phytase family protein n=1 Tax=Altericista sp. CCNU0014 TaxID=3082949 RepID=UPI00384B9810
MSLSLVLLLTGCSLPQVSAESRLFLNLSASLIADHPLAQPNFNGTTAGGFSAIAYSAQKNRIYTLANDATNPRLYTLNFRPINAPSSPTDLAIEAIADLKDPTEADSPPSTAPSTKEGLVLTRRGTAFVASEGNPSLNIPPRLSEFQITDGTWQQDLPLPKQYWPLQPDGTSGLGLASGRGLKSLAINEEGDRLFAATAAPLQQDASQPYSRFLHYWIGEPEPILISEHLYPLDSAPTGPSEGLIDLVSIDGAGHFLSLERSHSKTAGDRTVLYQLATGVATDTSGIRTLPPDLKGIVPILKKPLLDLAELDIPLQNLEGLTLGPRLPDGSRSLLLVGNNSTHPEVPTQVLTLKLERRSSQVESRSPSS